MRKINMPEADYAKFRRSRKSLEKICPLVVDAHKQMKEVNKNLNKAFNIAFQLNNESSKKNERDI